MSGVGGGSTVGLGLGSIGPSSGRSISQSSSSMGPIRERSSGPRAVRRVEDVYALVRDRLIAWSYLMQWYNG